VHDVPALPCLPGPELWTEAARGQRPGERASVQPDPDAYLDGQIATRAEMLAAWNRGLLAAGESRLHRSGKAHEALARALDWERLTGGLPLAESEIDELAWVLLAWLDHQGAAIGRAAGGGRREEHDGGKMKRVPA